MDQPDPANAVDADAVAAIDAFLRENEDWLMRRVLDYASAHGYTRYTSTLEEAWRVSVAGLSRSLVHFIETRGFERELDVDEDVTRDPAVAFGTFEAGQHRSRGVSLQMFMSLMKYYRRAFLDLADTREPEEATQLAYAVDGFFDRVEIGYCVEWSGQSLDAAFRELQDSNLELMNEKNKYLTLFMSLDAPVFLLGPTGKIDNLNQSASRTLGVGAGTGEGYYSGVGVGGRLEMLDDDATAFLEGGRTEHIVERELLTAEGPRHYAVMFKRMLDFSGKFTGATVTLADVTELKTSKDFFHALSNTDELTGVANRRHFLDLAGAELKRAARLGHPMSIALIDVDEFKEINDKYGHAAGDAALQALTRTFGQHIREIDLLARLGGDEFALLLPEADVGVAREAAERVRRSLETLKMDLDGSHASITISIGVSGLEPDDGSVDTLLARADRALYRAKRTGGNRTEVGSSTPAVRSRPA